MAAMYNSVSPLSCTKIMQRGKLGGGGGKGGNTAMCESGAITCALFPHGFTVALLRVSARCLVLFFLFFLVHVKRGFAWGGCLIGSLVVMIVAFRPVRFLLEGTCLSILCS